MEALKHIDEVCRKCGYFNTEEHNLFSGYSCFNPDCGDGNLAIRKKGIWEYKLHEGCNYEKEYNELSEKLFKEALKAYVYFVCEQQRESCVQNYISNMHSDSPVNNIRLALPPDLK